MSNISEIGGLIKARAEAVNAKRDTDYTAASADFISKAGDHVSALDELIAGQAATAEAQQLAHDDNFVASTQLMNDKIANFESNVDPDEINSLSEQVAAILAADGILDDSILQFQNNQNLFLAALEAEIGNEADVIEGMGLASEEAAGEEEAANTGADGEGADGEGADGEGADEEDPTDPTDPTDY